MVDEMRELGEIFCIGCGEGVLSFFHRGSARQGFKLCVGDRISILNLK